MLQLACKNVSRIWNMYVYLKQFRRHNQDSTSWPMYFIHMFTSNLMPPSKLETTTYFCMNYKMSRDSQKFCKTIIEMTKRFGKRLLVWLWRYLEMMQSSDCIQALLKVFWFVAASSSCVVTLYCINLHQEQQPPLPDVGSTFFCAKYCLFTTADPFSNKHGTSSICN